MTTEQCSVDSLLPKSRTEAFAKQLQNRLLTLNNEIIDKPDESNCNGDQRSSSSDDIFYDLDSYPGSPAEEARESNFGDYFNSKNSQCSQNSSTKTFLNHHKDTPAQLAENVKYICTENFEQAYYCGCCMSHRQQCDNTLSNSNRLNNYTIQNGVYRLSPPLENHQLSNNIKREQLFNNLTESNCTNCYQVDNAVSEVSSSFNAVGNRLHYNDQATNYLINEREYNSLSCENQQLNHLSDSEFCLSTLNNKIKTDVISNSTSCNNCVHKTLEYSSLVNIEKETSLELNTNCSNVNNNEQKMNETEDLTERDLCRLVDGMILKRQDSNSYPEKVQETDVESRTMIELKDEETIESKRSKFQRSSSLKSGKTPPGTPGHKKIVRFADVLGLDLADVRMFLDEVPKVPTSAFTDLKDVQLSSSPPVNMLVVDSFAGASGKTLVPLFQQPSSRMEFLQLIRDKGVCLESAVITDASLFTITGHVRVKNIDFYKSVHIRYSIDNWKSFADLQAKYVSNSCDGFSDKFTFALYAHMLNVGQRLEFAVRYHAGGCTFWDNNFGANYKFQCTAPMAEVQSKASLLPTASYVPPRPTETWAAFY